MSWCEGFETQRLKPAAAVGGVCRDGRHTLALAELPDVLDGNRCLERYEHYKLAASINEHYVESDDAPRVAYDDSPLPA
jgi:hypothetical protein